MFKIVLFFFGFSLFITNAQNFNTTLISNYNPHPQAGYSNLWGYTDSQGREYALLGTTTGTSIISLVNPANPVEVAFIPAPNSIWRELKVYGHYAYVCTDVTGAGLQIIDLSQLPDTAVLAATQTTYFNNGHDLLIEDGWLYVVGSEGGGGLQIFDLTNPINPVRTAYFNGSGYIHDIYVWNDSVIAACGNSQNYQIIDVTNKFAPFKVSQSAVLPGIYAHSGWMTEDKRYFYGTEEFNRRDITVWDLQDRTSWDLVVPQFGLEENVIAHNLYIIGDYAHVSYYEAGYVAIDVRNPAFPVIAGRFDTYPDGNGPNFDGAWGVYPFFESGNIILSDMTYGLYVIRFNPPSGYANQAPRINHSTNQYLTTTGNVTLTANIIDDSNLSDIKMRYRTIINGTASDWSLLSPSGNTGNNYNFNVPGQQHLTKVEYYFFAQDDSSAFTTSPTGGTLSNPPATLHSYTVIIAGTPQLLTYIPVENEITIAKNGRVNFSASAQDTSQLPVTLSWRKNGAIVVANNTAYTYISSSLSQAPRTDTVTLVVSNGFNSVSKFWLIHVENVLTSVKDVEIVNDYKLFQNHPNPFNPSTKIIFSIPEASEVTLTVYNMQGEKVEILENGFLQPGLHSYNFEAQNLVSGVYFYEIRTPFYKEMQKMILLK